MVNFVDVFVHRTPVQKLMGCRRRECKSLVMDEKKDLRTEEVEHIFINEKERDLKNGILPRGEGYLPGAHPETFGNRMKQPNLEKRVRLQGTRAIF